MGQDVAGRGGTPVAARGHVWGPGRSMGSRAVRWATRKTLWYERAFGRLSKIMVRQAR